MTTPLPDPLEALVRELAAEYFEPLDQPEAEEEGRLHDFFRRVLTRAGVPELVEALEATQAVVCDLHCPPVFKATRPPRHSRECIDARAALVRFTLACARDNTALARVRGERERCDWCDGRGLGAYLADYSGLDQHCTICGGSGEVDPSQLTETQRACIAAARARRREG